jgi:hypothetical protein
MEETITVSGKDYIIVGENFPFEKKNKKPLDVPDPEESCAFQGNFKRNEKFDLEEIDYCIDEFGNGITAEEVEEEIFNNEELDFE